MRCSTKERDKLLPSFVTSTPLSRAPYHSSLGQSCLSPIDESSPAPKHPLLQGKISKKLSNVETAGPSGGRPGLRTSRAGIRERPSNFLDEFTAENKKVGGRISRVEAILDEIVKESLHKSYANSQSPSNIKMKSDESVDAMIEQDICSKAAPPCLVGSSSASDSTIKESVQIYENSQNVPSLDVKEVNIAEEQVMKSKDNEVRHPEVRNRPKRGITRSSCQDEKENLVRKIINGSQEVEVFRVVPKPTNLNSKERGSMFAHESAVLNNLNDRRSCPNGDLKTAKKRKIFSLDLMGSTMEHNEIVSKNNQKASENRLPVLYKLSDIEWQKTKHEGVSIAKVFRSSTASRGYIKIDAKSVLKKKASNDQDFVVCDGTAEVSVTGLKSKISNGDMIQVPSGHEYEFLNRGIKKPLILNYICWR